jgi:apolipoprotein N-acyltransferase
MRKIQPAFLSVASGILLSIPWIFPTLGWTLFFAFVPLLLADNQHIWQNESGKRISSFCLGFIAFLIWNVLSSWWIAYVSLTGMLFVASLNALLMSSVWWCKNRVHQMLGATSGYFALIIFWIAFEFLNHYGLLPWPWLTLGNGLATSAKVIQWYEFTGVLGGSVWILLSNILIFLTVKNIGGYSLSKLAKSVGLSLVAIAFPMVLSVYLYSNYSEQGAIQHVVVLQPNIDPYTEKFSGMSAGDQINRLVSLAKSEITDSTDIVLLPETALPLLWEDSTVQQSQSLLPFTEIIERFPKISFMAGAITQQKFRKGEPISKTARQSDDGNFYFDRFNSAVLINRTGVAQYSHKNILVAGVEKDPFQEYLSFLPDFMLDLGGTKGGLASGKEPMLLEGLNGLKIGPVICFESVFGGYVRQLVKNGAQYIAVLTNDGWWKGSPGVWQHFAYSRIRAIETRRSIVRCANTGISGFIDQRGEVIAQTDANASMALSSRIRLNDSFTFYVRYGNYLGWISLFLSGMIAVYLLVYRRW